MLRVVVAVMLATLTACSQPLPEENSEAAHLYLTRCGQCHSPYHPQVLTAAMWQVEVPKMELKMSQAGLPALTEAQKAAIMSYLERNAGHH